MIGFKLLSVVALCCSFPVVDDNRRQLNTEVGAAKIDITPSNPQLLAGYGSRDREHEGIDSRLWARAMAIGRDEPVLLIAVDNCGVPKSVVDTVAAELGETTGIIRPRVVVCSTHTHNAPTLTGYAPVLWGGRITRQQTESIDRYTQWLTSQLVEVAQEALERRQPAALEWGQGRLRFGGNRRVLNEGRWQGFGFQFDGPVDHSLPLLVARGTDGDPLAIWTNYACHCTTLGARNRIDGDWAGYANEAIEREFPGAISLITIGCGADVGPQPTGSLELARQHGEALATEAKRLLGGELTPLPPNISASLETIQLPFDELPTREHFQRTAQLQNFDGYHARLMLQQLEQDGELPAGIDYPIGCWKFGDELCILFLAGEVVVDYAVRLKTELDWQRLWINGWSNDVPCYIPSRRVLAEGGYEADFSQIYYGHPTRFAPQTEDLIVDAVARMVGADFVRNEDSPKADFLRLPTGKERFADRLGDWLDNIDADTRQQLLLCKQLSRHSQSGFAEVIANDGGEDDWFNYAGIKVRRPYLRQLKQGDSIEWQTEDVNVAVGTDRHVFVFLGGVGWSSQPETAGFELRIDGEVGLNFDITTRPQTWQSEDGTITLHYLPTWTSDVDSGGFFYLEVPKARVGEGRACHLSVTSLGSGSQRWFSVDPIKDVKAIERILMEGFDGFAP